MSADRDGVDVSLSGLVSQRANVAADSECIVDAARTWTYGEAAMAIEQQSMALIEAGVRPGDRVGIHFNKSAEGFIAMHAAVSAGAVAVPLDPSSPASRLSQICDRMDISVVSTHRQRNTSIESLHALRPLRSVIGTEIALDGCESIGAEAVAEFEQRAPVKAAPEDLAYIVTTSGSTGEPKGICHTHSSGSAYADMTVQTFGIHASDRVADIAPHHFDISTFSLWGTPSAGATNIIVNEAYQRLPASHSQLLADQGVTVWYSVPFLIHQLVLRGDLANRNLDALRWVHFGGEVIPAEVIAAMMAHCPNAQFANIFGPAETNHVTHSILAAPPVPGSMLPIGTPIAGATVRIVRTGAETPSAENSVEQGEVGELWVSTEQMMASYWNDVDATAASIQVVDGMRLYCAGDLVSEDADGILTFHGRSDQQIKVRGFRVEVEGVERELESIVRRLGCAENVVISVRRHSDGEDELVAGILGSTPIFNETEFVRQAASVIPAYAVPTRTTMIENAVFTGSGKLDRRTLRDSTLRQLEDS